jgi:SAM-dependent methyltransferase
VFVTLTKACEACGAREGMLLFRWAERSDRYCADVVRCRRCGLVFRAADSGAIALLSGRDLPDTLNGPRMEVFRQYAEMVSPYRSTNRILDVGAGDGYYLKLCKERGWDVQGVEPNADLVAHAQSQHGISLFRGRLHEAKYPSDFFDVVTLWNVLEHVPNPFQIIGEACRVLRTDGALVCRTTNAAFHIPCRRLFLHFSKIWRVAARFDGSVIHHHCFDRASISSLLKRTGLLVVDIKNAAPTQVRERLEGRMFGASLCAAAEKALAFLEIASFGRALYGPSLLVRAVKPRTD